MIKFAAPFRGKLLFRKMKSFFGDNGAVNSATTQSQDLGSLTAATTSVDLGALS